MGPVHRQKCGSTRAGWGRVWMGSQVVWGQGAGGGVVGRGQEHLGGAGHGRGALQ